MGKNRSEEITGRESVGASPRVSVVMSVYNTAEKYLREAISSILSQTYDDFEFLIVDDGSDSYIEEIVGGYSDERIRYFRLSENSGAAVARNYALDKARGEMIAFLDSDDIALPERLEKQLNYLQQHPDIGLVATAFREIGGCVSRRSYGSSDNIKTYLLFIGCAFCHSSVMLRKSILDTNNVRYDNYYVPAEDYALWLELIGHTRFAILPEVLSVYRKHSLSISATQHALQMRKCSEAQLRAVEKYCHLEIGNSELWHKFYSAQCLTKREMREFQELLETTLDKLVAQVYAGEELSDLFRQKFRKLYHKTRTVRGQWVLLHAGLARYFKLPWWWRLFYFVTRGIL